ncbi:HAD hydrolase-like protein [Methanomethylophilus alvi]|uniref:HAD hydrolase-like protein n=1 Tax=Methanomethylophilus alvi TaxID=1291540 RepID=UPI0037DD705E
MKIGFIEAGINVCNENEAETLVIGMDMEYSYEKMTKGLRAAIRSKKIIVCNEDRYFEKEDGIYPGNGGMTSSILYCSNKKPDIIVGKPNTLMLEHFCKYQKYSKDEIIVIGDSDESDMIMANKFGCKFIQISKIDKKDIMTIKSLKETVYWNWSDEIWK